MNSTSVHWHILGAGAMGSLFADALSNDNSEVSLILRSDGHRETRTQVVERGDQLSKKCLKITGPTEQSGISHLLVTTKAYDVCAAIERIAHRLNPDCHVVLLSNGLGFQEEVLASWPALDVYCGTTTEGAHITAEGHIRHAGAGETRIGRATEAPGQPPPVWFYQWEHAINNSLWDEKIHSALWAKLAVNCVINPLTALHRCHNGALHTTPALAVQIPPLCDEIAAVCRARGHRQIAEALPHLISAVIDGTARNRSSMLQDREAGRPTEIDFITGYLLDVARQCGIRAPLNRALFEAIKAHEP